MRKCIISVLTIIFFMNSEGCKDFPKVTKKGECSIFLEGNPDRAVPSAIYTVVLAGENPFSDFFLTTEGSGSFQVIQDDDAVFSPSCANTVVQNKKTWRKAVSVLWMAPTTGCVTFTGAVLMKTGWKLNSKSLCVIDMEPEDVQPKSCCSCDHAKYRIVFEGLWSPERHPKNFPTLLQLTHFSDVIGASHTSNFTVWEEGKTASYGLRQLAEFGIVRELETELRNASTQLRSIVKAAGLWYPNLNGNTTAVFRVDPRRNLLSLASMFGPSPDWIVGVSGLNLCLENCTWLESMVIDLYPYDAGADTGITYMSPRSPADPFEKIRRITTMYPEDSRAPFYNPNLKEMPSLAKLYIFREKVIPKSCRDLSLDELYKEISYTENTEESFREECAVGDYSDWSSCSVTCGKGIRVRTRTYKNSALAAQFSCDRQLVSKEMCLTDQPLCPGDEEEIEIEQLSKDGECEVTKWSEWSDCSVTCGIGFILRSRSFLNESLQMIKKCMHVPTMEKEKCMLPPCKPSLQHGGSGCSVGEWSRWSPCSNTCGKGVRTRVRKLTDTRYSCRSKVVTTETHNCHTNCTFSKEICLLEPTKGPCRGEFRKWAYLPSKKKCILFDYGGCRGNRNKFETEDECNDFCGIPEEHLESINQIDSKEIKDCRVSKWSEWSSCLPCPNGFRKRNRTIIEEPSNGGRPCPVLSRIVKCSVPAEFCLYYNNHG